MGASKYDVPEVWKNVVVPSILYGRGVIGWNASEKLEVSQNKNRKNDT